MEVKMKFDLPVGEIPLLRLSHISRWGIIKMEKEQSVGEHTFNVIAIADWICSIVETTISDRAAVMRTALYHDADEIYTGDIPTPAKTSRRGPLDLVSNIVKLADCIEAYQFASKHCNDSLRVTEWLIEGLWDSIADCVHAVPGISLNEIKNMLGE